MRAPEEVIRAYMDAWNARDRETILGLADENVEYVNPPMALVPGTRRGRDALVRVCEEQWEALDAVFVERIERRDDAFVTVAVLRGTIPGSDRQLDTPLLARWHFKDGLIARIEILGAGSSFEDALEAAGLKGSGQPTEERQDGQDTA